MRATWILIWTSQLARSFFCPKRSMTSCQPAELIANPGSHILHDIVIVTRPGASVSSAQIRQAMTSVDPNLPIISIGTLAGHKLRLYLTTDDQNADRPALLGFRHASVGTSSFNSVFSSSRLLLPVLR
jgi:hypothetical protein